MSNDAQILSRIACHATLLDVTLMLMEPRAEQRRDRLARAGRWLVTRREERGLTQRKVAALVDRSPQVMSTYERGVIEVPEELVGPLAKALDVSVAELRTGLGLFVHDVDLAASDGFLRLPKGVKLSELEPIERETLMKLVDTYLDSILRDQ